MKAQVDPVISQDERDREQPREAREEKDREDPAGEAELRVACHQTFSLVELPMMPDGRNRRTAIRIAKAIASL